MKRALLILLASAQAALGAQISGLTAVTSLTNTDYLIADVYTNAAYATRSILYQNAVPPVYQAATIIVDGTYGSDTTGARGTKRPYATLLSALAAVQSGDIVLIQPGTFQFASHTYTNDSIALTASSLALSELSDVTILGYGATLEATNFGHLLTIEQCTNILIEGIRFTVSSNGWTTNTTTHWQGNAINFRQTNHTITIRNCEFVDCVDNAIHHNWTELGRQDYNITVDGCRFSNIGTTNLPAKALPDGACFGGAPKGFVFRNNWIENAIQGVSLDGMHNLGSVYEQTMGPGIIVGNHFRGIRWFGISFYSDSTMPADTRGIVISGNYFTNHPTCPSGAYMLAFNGGRDITISGNTFDCSIPATTDPQIYLLYMHDLSSNAVPNSNVIVSANVFRGGSYGVAMGASQLARHFGTVFQGNTFADQGEISLGLAGTSTMAIGNTFLGAGRASGAAIPWAIRALETDTVPYEDLIIEGNILDDRAPTATTTRFVGVASTATTKSSTVRVRNNYVHRMSGWTAYEYTSGINERPLYSMNSASQIYGFSDFERVAGNSDPKTLTGTPTVAAGYDGQTLTIVGNNDTWTVTFQDQDILPGSGLTLGSTNRVLGAGDILQLRYDAVLTNWIETSFINN